MRRSAPSCGRDNLLHPRRQGVVPPVERLHHHAPRARRHLRHLPRLRLVGRERLLAEHVLAGLERPDRPLGVEAVGQGVVHGRDGLVREERLVARRHARDAVLRRERLRPPPIPRRHARDLDLVHALRRPNQRHRRDPRRPQDPHPQLAVRHRAARYHGARAASNDAGEPSRRPRTCKRFGLRCTRCAARLGRAPPPARSSCALRGWSGRCMASPSTSTAKTGGTHDPRS